MVDWEEHRRRMIAEVSAFITWGLANPDKVRRIPRKRLGTGGFSRTMQRVFWMQVFTGGEPTGARGALGRLLRRLEGR